MNILFHDQLDKLRIISKIKEGDKLDVAYGVDIQENRWFFFSWFGRFMSKNSKEESVKSLRELYRSVNQSVEQILEIIEHTDSDQKKERQTFTAINFAEKLRSSLVGLENLARTYSEFPSIVSKIEGIVQDYLWPTYAAILKNIPIEQHSAVLTEPLISRFLAQQE